MLRIRDIAMGPEQDVTALLFEAAKILRISASEIQSVSLVRRSVDARKKPDVKFIYTVDVTLKSGEGKILKKCGSKKVTPAPTELYKPPKRQPEREKRPVVIGFGPAGMFGRPDLTQAGRGPSSWSGGRMQFPAMKRWRPSGRTEPWTPKATSSSARAARGPFRMAS